MSRTIGFVALRLQLVASCDSSHVHGNVLVAGHAVHIDIVAARRSNPTFAFRDYRIYRDGILIGRALHQRCGLGDTLDDLPAIALVERYAVTLRAHDPSAPVVQLWTTAVV